MSNTGRSFTVDYNPINKSNTFTSGDCISGQITLELLKECKIESISVKLKGKAEVEWSENQKVLCQSEVLQYQAVYPSGGPGELPPSFKSKCGKIVYSLEANLSRPRSLGDTAKAKFTLIHEGIADRDRTLMDSQHGVKERKKNLFTSGSVSMDVKIKRKVFRQGEGINIVASIQNKSCCDIKPKYCLYQKRSFFAKGKRRVDIKDILKEGRMIAMISADHVFSTGLSGCQVGFRPRDQVPHSHPACFRGVWWGASACLSYECEESDESSGGTSFIQNPTASDPSAPPPSYGTYVMYPIP